MATNHNLKMVTALVQAARLTANEILFSLAPDDTCIGYTAEGHACEAYTWYMHAPAAYWRYMHAIG